MKNTKLITKLVAFALVLCMAVSMLASCGSNDAIMSMTIDGNTYTLTEKEFSLLMTIKKLDYCCSMYMPRAYDTEETWAKETEEGSGITLETYYKNMILDQAKAILIEKYLFDKFDLTISDETVKKNKENEKTAIKNMGGAGAYKQYYGYTAEQYYTTYQDMVARSEAVLDYLCGENGEYKVNDEDLAKFYTENYIGFQYIMLDMKNKVKRDENGNRVLEEIEYDHEDHEGHDHSADVSDTYELEELSEEEKSEKQNLAATIFAELEAGTKTFEELIELYSDDYYSVEYPEGLFVIEEGTFINATVDAEAKKLEIGEYTDEAISVSSDAYQYIVKRIDLKEAVYNDDHYLSLFDGYEDTVMYDKYENHIKTYFENISVDEAVSARYTFTDTFLSEYADVNFQYYYYGLYN
ncbi:MAG: hypothetical protein IJY37_01710 [Clostridia bacterium]|nr:hypothetical protein [Clostridia bacterium]